ncbi:MAG: SBBP repeat-containing protein [Chlorobi bacterium]|nr:SBBP repeat-containing protein [Chlorobiota bacterium]MCI0716800.1 SBBP repeat-containing protein [Chlorobiota bacterium]
MRKIIAILFLVFLCSHNVNTKVSQEWVSGYSGPVNNYNSSNSIAIDVQGNIYVAATSAGFGTGLDIILIKYNAAGSILWIERFNGTANSDDEACSVGIDAAGNVYVSGSVLNTGTAKDVVTIKYNSNGEQLWAVIYNGVSNQDDAAKSMVVDNAGNTYITAYTTSPAYSQDFATMKYNTAGELLWMELYNGPEGTYDEPFAITLDDLGNVYVCGLSRGVGTKRDYATLKYSPEGKQEWVSRYNGPSNGFDMAYAIAADENENVYVTGTSWDWFNVYDYLTLKYNSQGEELWNVRYDGGGAGSDIARSIAVDSEGNVFITGEVWTGNFDKDYGTIKYNSTGEIVWVRTYNGPGNNNDIANSMTTDYEGNIYVTGWSRSGSNFGTEDFATIKYNTIGAQKWIARFNSSGNNEDIANSIAVNAAGDVYIAGRSKLSSYDFEVTTIKYSQVIGIEPVSGSIPKSFLLHQNFPNPFNPTTQIKFDLPKQSFVRLIVYDASGRKVSTLVNSRFNPGSYLYEWIADSYPSGIYFYKLTAEGYVQTKKMVLVK